MRKFNPEIKVVKRVLDSQRDQLQNDINNLKELKDKKYDLDDLYQKYITDYKLSKNGKQINMNSLGEKHSTYLKDMGLNPEELTYRFVKMDLPI